jgi:hypothetical protein
MINSAVDDFSRLTLGAIPGTLGKLLYVAGLRQTNGAYYHWGLTRTHGEKTADLAIGEAHSHLFSSLLRTPIRNLWQEAGSLAEEQNTEVRVYVDCLIQKGDLLIPVELHGGGRHHFNSVLLALCCLAGLPAPKAGPIA